MILLVARILRRRRLSVCRKRVETIPPVFVELVLSPSGAANGTTGTEVRSASVVNFGIEELPCAKAPLPSLKHTFSQIDR